MEEGWEREMGKPAGVSNRGSVATIVMLSLGFEIICSVLEIFVLKYLSFSC